MFLYIYCKIFAGTFSGESMPHHFGPRATIDVVRRLLPTASSCARAGSARPRARAAQRGAQRCSHDDDETAEDDTGNTTSVTPAVYPSPHQALQKDSLFCSCALRQRPPTLDAPSIPTTPSVSCFLRRRMDCLRSGCSCLFIMEYTSYSHNGFYLRRASDPGASSASTRRLYFYSPTCSCPVATS